MSKPAHVGPYELVEVIAQSDIALSYGVQLRTRSGADRIAAMKVLNPQVTSRGNFARRLTEQARLAAQLNHVNLAQTWDCGCRDGVYYLLLEYVEGVPLSVLLGDDKVLPADVATYIAAEVCAGLSYAHARRDDNGEPLGVVHGDVRPRHVMVSGAGAVKLVDFGVARARKMSEDDPVPENLREIDLFGYADPQHAA